MLYGIVNVSFELLSHVYLQFLCVLHLWKDRCYVQSKTFQSV